MYQTISRIIVVLYIGGTLFIRFLLEPQLQGRFVYSIALGLFALLFLYALIKSRLLRPNWFGFEQKGNSEL